METHTIISYGILRKRQLLQKLLHQFGVHKATTYDDKIQGYTCYHHNGINMMFAVNKKLSERHPNNKFIIPITVIEFEGNNKAIKELTEFIDKIEYGYYKKTITTIGNRTGTIYLMSEVFKKLHLTDFSGIGMVIYPDTIFNHMTLFQDHYETYENDNVTVRAIHWTPVINQTNNNIIALPDKSKETPDYIG